MILNGALWTDAYDDVDPADLGPRGRRRQFRDGQILARDVLELARRLAEEMMVIARVGVEIRPAGLNDHFVQQP